MDYYKLKTNPSNPRHITKERFEKLKKSLEGFNKMLVKRPIAYDEDGIIWGGNMRYLGLSALVDEGKMQFLPEYFTSLEGWTLEEKKEFAIKDNNPVGLSGDWDWDIMANEWSDMPLDDWGINTGEYGEDFNYDEMWKGMPDFNGIKEGNAFRSIIVHFDNQEGVDKFAKIMGETITEKTKYIWYPRKERRDLKSLEVRSNES